MTELVEDLGAMRGERVKLLVGVLRVTETPEPKIGDAQVEKG
jgi:hypothetical protein